jgi:large subunit ribosomal protein L18
MTKGKKQSRLRRAARVRAHIRRLSAHRLTVHRTPRHFYAQVIAPSGDKVLAAATTLDAEFRKQHPNGGNTAAADALGKILADKAKAAGIEQVAFDRSGFRYHGRVKAFAEAARGGGLKF